MPYQSTPADRARAYTIGAVYVILALALAIMLFKIWPPIPWPSDHPKDKERLAAIIKEAACSETATATPTPQASPTASPTVSAGPTASTSPSPAATPSATPRPSGTQPASQPSTSPVSNQTPTPAAAASPAVTPVVNLQTGELEAIPMKLFGQCVQTTFDERLLLLVIIVGMLGAFVHGATSLADYLGNNAFNKSWTWFYLLRPAIGMALALVFYFAIRGGFLSTTGGAKDINPYGIAALAGMVGMFSKQATDKLGEVFTTLFRSGGDERRADSLNGTAGALQLDPPSAVAGGEAFKLTVAGTGFVNGATINVNDNPLTTTFESATKLSAQIAKETIANAGTLKVTVVNPDQTKTGPVDFVVSAASAGAGSTETPVTLGGADTTAAEQPVTGEGGSEDLIDGCDVEMKADTPDEDLPITEGGVK